MRDRELARRDVGAVEHSRALKRTEATQKGKEKRANPPPRTKRSVPQKEAEKENTVAGNARKRTYTTEDQQRAAASVQNSMPA